MQADTVDDYYVAGQGWSFLLDAWLPPLIASGLFSSTLAWSAEDIPKLWSAIQKIKGTTVSGGDMVTDIKHLIRGLNTWKKPRMFMGWDDACYQRKC